MKAKISLITLGVNDLPTMLEFYQKLGFEAQNYTPGDEMVMFKLDGTWLGLFPKDKLMEDAAMPATSAEPERIALAHNVSSKAEADTTMQHFLTAGARLQKPAHDTFWGGYSGYVADPDGFLWEICWNPFTDLT